MSQGRPGFVVFAINGVLQMPPGDVPPDPDLLGGTTYTADTTFDLDVDPSSDLIATHIMSGVTSGGYITLSSILADDTAILYHGKGYCIANSGPVPTGNLTVSHQVLFQDVPRKCRITLYRADGTHGVRLDTLR